MTAAIKIGQKYGRKTYKYKDIPYEKDEWIPATEWIPADGDLCTLKTKKNKTFVGWSYNRAWYGHKHEKNNEITHWKKKKEL